MPYIYAKNLHGKRAKPLTGLKLEYFDIPDKNIVLASFVYLKTKFPQFMLHLSVTVVRHT